MIRNRLRIILATRDEKWLEESGGVEMPEEEEEIDGR